MSIDRNDWLDQARRLAVGRTERVPHRGNCRTRSRPSPNMVLFNEVDHWGCYCFSCGEGGRVDKEHVRLDTGPVHDARDTGGMSWPDDAVPLMLADAGVQAKVWAHVAGKGLDFNAVLVGIPLQISTKQQRLLIPCSEGWLGRSLNPQRVPKWVSYRGASGYPQYAMHYADRMDHRAVVLTEDFYSALKIRWATAGAVLPVALLGTKIKQRLLQSLLSREVLLFMDGDDAGYRAAQSAFKRLRGLDVQARIIDCPPGKDPKDLSKRAIQEALC